MIWEQRVSIVVALTRLSEGNSQMCACYWPSAAASAPRDGASPAPPKPLALSIKPSLELEVHLVSEHVTSGDFVVRNMCLVNRASGETRALTQFHYLAWPKGGVPDNARSLLFFRR